MTDDYEPRDKQITDGTKLRACQRMEDEIQLFTDRSSIAIFSLHVPGILSMREVILITQQRIRKTCPEVHFRGLSQDIGFK
jgi:hypothetical protein